ncbi:MAG: hypothetical protein ACFCUO_10570 [Rhodospirillales bacterium]
MVSDRVTGSASEASIHGQPDKRWLGVLLCAVSATLTLMLGAMIASTVLTRGDAGMIAEERELLDSFKPAAGPDRR